jgi:hypothetical protein
MNLQERRHRHGIHVARRACVTGTRRFDLDPVNRIRAGRQHPVSLK